MSFLLAAALMFAPCEVKGVSQALCGTIAVPENPAVTGGRRIGLHVVVLPARRTASHDAIVILQGGPGQAATQLAEFYAGVFEGARDSRDIVLIDQRGTGKSHSLTCDLTGPGLFPPEKVAACRQSLEKQSDLRMYTTAEAVADLERVRRALRYTSLDLYGTSYGSRVAFEYTRRFPNRVRSMILKGIVGPSLRYTVDPAIDTDTSLQRVIGEATAVFPNLKSEYERFLATLPRDGVTRDDVAFEIRMELHSLPTLAGLPALLHAGDAKTFGDRARDHYAALSRELSLGMYLSVVCAEDVWRVTDAEAQRVTAGTVTGDAWQRRLSAACRIWPHKPPQEEVATALRSDVPTLLISGAYDPVTPPHRAEAAARTLRNSRHVIVKNGSHSFAGMMGCVDRIMSAFVLSPDPKNVDATCASAIPAPVYKKQ